MRPDPNYPRWMFHRSKPMVCVNSQEEEAALGREWSRTPLPSAATALPKEDKPEPEEPVEDEPEEPEEEKPEEEPHPATRPVRPPARKTAARKPAARTKAHKR